MSQHTHKLSDGNVMPIIGLGTYTGSRKDEVGDAVKCAIKSGYRHIDAAEFYKNQKEIGHALTEVLAEGEVKREELYVVSKLWNTCHSKELVRKHCEITLSELNLKYIDLYLIHWPIAFVPSETNSLESQTNEDGSVKIANIPISETWSAMESLVKDGLVRSIGVSNFNVQSLVDLLTYAKIKPVVNQVELHPYLSQPNLKSFCDLHNIFLTAYSPLGAGKITHSPIIEEIAKKHNKTAANVIIRWCYQYGVSAIPKSVTPSRIIENFNVFDFTLTDSEMEQIGSLNTNNRVISPIKQWGIPLFD